tara:strand:- start:295 stop:567 length:273 start_codon:yes stop_codon:yes gene_type:complete
MMSELSVEDDEMLHNLVDEVVHSQGWSIGVRHVRDYHQQCPCDEPNCIEYSKHNIEDSVNSPENEAFIDKRTDDEINEMIERIHMEEELK